MKRLALITFLLCSVQTAYGADAMTRFDALLRANAVTNFSGVSFGGPHTSGTKPAGLRVDWLDAATDQEKSTESTLSNSFDWLDQPNPNIQGFELAVFVDGTLPVVTKVEIYKWFPLLEAHAGIDAQRKLVWSQLVEAYGASWLDAPTQTILKNYASTANMPFE